MIRLLLFILLLPMFSLSQLNYEKKLVEIPGAKIQISNKTFKLFTKAKTKKFKIKSDFLLAKTTDIINSEIDTSLYKYFIRNNDKYFIIDKKGKVNETKYFDKELKNFDYYLTFHDWDYMTKKRYNLASERFRISNFKNQLLIQNWKPKIYSFIGPFDMIEYDSNGDTLFDDWGDIIYRYFEDGISRGQYYDTITIKMEGNSGVYDFSNKNWFIKPDKQILQRINNHYIYSQKDSKENKSPGPNLWTYTDSISYSIMNRKGEFIRSRMNENTFFNDTSIFKYKIPTSDKKLAEIIDPYITEFNFYSIDCLGEIRYEHNGKTGVYNLFGNYLTEPLKEFAYQFDRMNLSIDNDSVFLFSFANDCSIIKALTNEFSFELESIDYFHVNGRKIIRKDVEKEKN